MIRTANLEGLFKAAKSYNVTAQQYKDIVHGNASRDTLKQVRANNGEDVSNYDQAHPVVYTQGSGSDQLAQRQAANYAKKNPSQRVQVRSNGQTVKEYNARPITPSQPTQNSTITPPQSVQNRNSQPTQQTQPAVNNTAPRTQVNNSQQQRGQMTTPSQQNVIGAGRANETYTAAVGTNWRNAKYNGGRRADAGIDYSPNAYYADNEKNYIENTYGADTARKANNAATVLSNNWSQAVNANQAEAFTRAQRYLDNGAIPHNTRIALARNIYDAYEYRNSQGQLTPEEQKLFALASKTIGADVNNANQYALYNTWTTANNALPVDVQNIARGPYATTPWAF